jgi:hypothetical protein
MRVYLPATLPIVADLLSAGSLPGPAEAYAVTAVLRAWADASGPSDEEELELVALSEAARASLRLLAGADASRALRVVLAADVPDARVRVSDGPDTAGPGQVVVTEALPLAWVRAVHVDDPDAEPDVRTASSVVCAADSGDAAAEALVAALDAHELLWYATDELPALVG